MAKSKNPKPRPAPWPAWPDYPGDAAMASPDWAEWACMTDDGWIRGADDKVRVLADWLEENGLDSLAGCMRHWADATPRVRWRYSSDYVVRMIYLCRDLAEAGRPGKWTDVPALWARMGQRWATFDTMVRLTPRPPKRR